MALLNWEDRPYPSGTPRMLAALESFQDSVLYHAVLHADPIELNNSFAIGEAPTGSTIYVSPEVVKTV